MMKKKLSNHKESKKYPARRLRLLVVGILALLAFAGPVAPGTVAAPDPGNAVESHKVFPTITPRSFAQKKSAPAQRTAVASPTSTPSPTATGTATATATVTRTATAPAPAGSGLLDAFEQSIRASEQSGSLGREAAVAISQTVPVRLQIPVIDVDADIQTVGRDPDDAMATPDDPDDVAWYGPGAGAGEQGNAVLAGHLDRIGGAPAVFWRLEQLEVGDDVYLTGSNGVTYRYRVTDEAVYPYDRSPIQEIFGFTVERNLNLITCRGSWDRGRQTYTQRFVVYTELIGTGGPEEGTTGQE